MDPGHGFADQLLALLAQDPTRDWQTREIADALGITADPTHRSLWVQLCRWSKLGLIRKTGWRTYSAATPVPAGQPLQPAPKPANRRTRLLAFLQTEPTRTFTRQQLATAIGIPEPERPSFYNQLTTWTRQGIIHRSSTGRYALPEKFDLTTPTTT